MVPNSSSKYITVELKVIFRYLNYWSENFDWIFHCHSTAIIYIFFEVLLFETSFFHLQKFDRNNSSFNLMLLEIKWTREFFLRTEVTVYDYRFKERFLTLKNYEFIFVGPCLDSCQLDFNTWNFPTGIDSNDFVNFH